MYSKKLIRVLCLSLMLSLPITSAKATEECFEGVSRAMFSFNMAFDDIILEPIAKGYNKLPKPLKDGTGNFTSNIATLLSIPNNLLQGNIKQLGHSTGSFIVNTSIGILGFFNPAEKIGLKPYKEDVGQTLGSYGVGPGCYFVLPILGPTTLRDSFGMIADNQYLDAFARVTWHEKEIKSLSGNKLDYVGVKAATAIDFRGENMTNFESLEKNSIDLYAATKSLYLQNRSKKIKNETGTDDDAWGDLDK